MSQLSDQRINELLASAEGLAVGEDGELHALLAEVRERRKQAGYSRQQRFDFMIRFVKDAAPEIARELREIYTEQENAIYYARRDAEYWKTTGEDGAAHLRGCLRDAMAFIDPDVAGDYKFWKEALER